MFCIVMFSQLTAIDTEIEKDAIKRKGKSLQGFKVEKCT